MDQITKVDIIEALPDTPFLATDVVSFDLEIFGGIKKKLHRPIGKFASLALCADGQTSYVITDQRELSALETILFKNRPILVAHNASFDIRQLRRWMSFPVTDRLHDTMLFERILYNGLYENYSAADLSRRYLNLYMDKSVREKFEKATTLSEEMIRYNAIDAVTEWRFYQEQIQRAKKDDWKIWREIDGPAMWAFLDFKGAYVDREKWLAIADANEAIANALLAEFPFNPRSPAQVKKYLTSECKLNIASTNEKELANHLDVEIVQKLLKYREVEKMRSTYGKTWADEYIESDNRVYTSYDVNRAESGRTSSSNPNIQNIPTREHPELRECFVAPDGYVLVGGDFSQQEVRIAAYLGNDENMIAIFARKGDIYCETASIMYGEPVSKADERRQRVKALVLGIIYGMSAYGLAARTGMTKEEAEEFINLFFYHFPGIKQYTINQSKATKWVKTPSGRRSWINLLSSSGKRNALNSPCQGGGADMMKRLVALMHQRWDTSLEPFPATLQVHDELVLEVKECNAEYAKTLMEQCMTESGEWCIPGVPIAYNIKIGHSWHDIH